MIRVIVWLTRGFYALRWPFKLALALLGSRGVSARAKAAPVSPRRSRLPWRKTLPTLPPPVVQKPAPVRTPRWVLIGVGLLLIPVGLITLANQLPTPSPVVTPRPTRTPGFAPAVESSPPHRAYYPPPAPAPVSTSRCLATTHDGHRCTRAADPGSAYCWQHQHSSHRR